MRTIVPNFDQQEIIQADMVLGPPIFFLGGGSKEKHPFKVNGKIESPVVLHLK